MVASFTNVPDGFGTVAVFSLLIFLDVMAILAIPSFVTGRRSVPYLGNVGVVMVLIGLTFLNYRALVSNGRLERIVEEFGHESEEERRHGNHIVLFYIVCSLLLPLVVAALYILLWGEQ